MNENNWTPVPKVTTAALIGAVVVVVTWVAQVIFKFGLPTPVAEAIQLVFMSAAAYIKK